MRSPIAVLASKFAHVLLQAATGGRRSPLLGLCPFRSGKNFPARFGKTILLANGQGKCWVA